MNDTHDDITHESTMRRIMRTLVGHTPSDDEYSLPLWVVVKELTMHGSGYSQRICRMYGYDPDTLVIMPKWVDMAKKVICDYCPECETAFMYDETCHCDKEEDDK